MLTTAGSIKEMLVELFMPLALLKELKCPLPRRLSLDRFVSDRSRCLPILVHYKSALFFSLAFPKSLSLLICNCYVCFA